MNTATDDTVRLHVNGARFEGWKSVGVTAGIDRAAREFTLSVTHRWPGQDIQRRVSPGDRCELYIGNDKVLTGWVDGTPISHDKASVTVGVKGRSLTGDLVDCAAVLSGGQWIGQRVENIAQALARPYKVTVRAEANTGAAIADHQIQPGEAVLESIDRLLKQRGLLATDNAQGELVFIVPGALRATTALVVGENLLNGSAPLDFKDRFSEYHCFGQQSLVDVHGTDGAVSSQSAKSVDDGVSRFRLLVVQQSGQGNEGTCQQRADNERAQRAGKALATNYTVQGWRQGDGRLWLPNMLVRVIDPIIGFDREMLITEVTWTMGDGGMLTAMRVAPLSAYKLAGISKSGGAKSGQGWGDVKPQTAAPGPRPK